MQGDFSAGSRLPTEIELALQFDVSRGTVREALRILSSEGLLTTSRGVTGGSSVAEFDPAVVSDRFQAVIEMMTRFEGCTLEELLETRELFEVTAAQLAASRRSDDQLVEIRNSLMEVSATSKAGDLFRANSDFHEGVLGAAHNRLLHATTEPVFKVLENRFFARGKVDHVFWRQVYHDHDAILQAIEKRDPELAGREMSLHLRNVRGTYERIDSRLARGRGKAGR